MISLLALTASGNVIVSGNLTVNGTTTTVNSNTVNIGDNILVLNSDATGTSQDAGIEIERGDDTNVSFLWDETNDRWTAGNKNIVATTFIGNLTGNATTVTNGIYTTSSVADLNDVSSVGSGAIITSAERTKLTNIEALADVTDATNVAAAGAVMNTGDETIAGAKTFSSTIVGDISGNAATVTNGIYTSSSVTSLVMFQV